MSNVTSLSGSGVAVREPSPAWVRVLEEELERARSGETVGGVLIRNFFDLTVSYTYAGDLNLYQTLGAMAVVGTALAEDARGD